MKGAITASFKLSPTSLSFLADSHPLFLPLLFMVSLSLSWRLIPLSSFSCGGEQSRAHPNRLGLSEKLFLSVCPSPSLILSVCLFCGWEGTLLHPALNPLWLLSFYSRNLSAVTAAKNGCTNDGLHQQLIAIFVPSVSFHCLNLIIMSILLL